MVSLDDFVDEKKNFSKAVFMPVDFHWWVPRRLGDSSLEFPDPQRMKTRVPDAWPRRLDDPTISTMPIISDWILGFWDEAHTNAVIHGGTGGHVWSGDIRNLNLGFADGHVETRSKAQLRWQVVSHDGQYGYVY